MGSYNVLLILIIILFTYFVTFYSAKKNKIKLITHRKIWNIVLLISFLLSCLLGLLLAIMIDNKLSIGWYYNILWLHVEFGITMTIISIFHIIWHLSYYKNIFTKNKQIEH